MFQGIADDLGYYVRLSWAAMLMTSNSLEIRALACQRLADLRDERPDLV